MKRFFDLVFGSLILALLLIPMLLVAFVVRATSNGSALYWSDRIGQGNVKFSMPKFRTMRVETPEVATHLIKTPEEFISPIGGYLRKFSLDELPQLFNVLAGDMSLVGPRPERPVFVNEFRKSIPKYMLRLKVKAGLTGWAQVNGWRGNTSLEKRIEFDLYYIKNWSLLFDLKIILMTFWKGFINPHAY